MALTVKKSLSKNLTGMKFMQKGSSSLASESKDYADASAGGDLIDKWIVPNVPTVDTVTCKTKPIRSFVECEGLNMLGRFSFNKFNKGIERLSERYARQGGVLDEDSEEEHEEEVSVQEMVRRYEDITSRKLLGKHGRLNDEADFDSPPSRRFSSESTGRHKLLANRVSKMDRDGFLRPS